MKINDKIQSIANCMMWRKEFDELASKSMEESKRCRSQIQQVQIQPRGKTNTYEQIATNGGYYE